MAHDALVCPRCGNLRSECSDPTRDWHPHADTCWATATREWGARRLAEKHKDDEPNGDTLHPLDGVSVYAAPFAPDHDDFE